MSKFCHNCGKQMPSVDAKFCSFCGTSLQSLSSKPTPPQQATPSYTPYMVGGSEEDEYIDRITHLDIRINALDFDLKMPQAPAPDKLGEIAAKEANVEPINRFKPFATVSKDEFLRAFEKEAGPSKGSTNVG